MTSKYDELKKLAEESFPGPWKFMFDDTAEVNPACPHIHAIASKDGAFVCGFEKLIAPVREQQAATVKFILAANPATVLELINDYERLRAALRRIADIDPARDAKYTPFDHRYTDCFFQAKSIASFTL